jgi:DNA polymerase III subunit beta
MTSTRSKRVQVARKDLLRLLEKTHFSMAQQDVRYYLNGMLLEIDGQLAASGGDRRSSARTLRGALAAKAKSAQQVIVPRKGVLELQRILTPEGVADLAIGTNHVRAQIGDVRFTSKLIDGRFPEYSRVIPAAPPARSIRRIAIYCGRRCSERRSCRTRNIAGSGSP